MLYDELDRYNMQFDARERRGEGVTYLALF